MIWRLVWLTKMLGTNLQAMPLEQSTTTFSGRLSLEELQDVGFRRGGEVPWFR